MWKTIGATLLLTGILSGLGQRGVDALEPYSFADIFNSSLRPRGFSATWVTGKDQFYYRSSEGHVLLYYAVNDTTSVLVNSSHFDQVKSSTYFLSHSLSHVLFAYDIESLWRYSYRAKYKILDLSTNALTDFPNGTLAGQALDYAQWAPSSLALSFVYMNNLYYQSDPNSDPVQVTFDGKAEDVFNGISDWLYEEDVLGERVTHYWSPDSKYICYARINASAIPFITWPVYGDKADVYGTTQRVRYPKTGDVRAGKAGPNSVAELFVVDTSSSSSSSNSSVSLPPPDEFNQEDHYYLQVTWSNNTSVHITWSNRVQNHSISQYYDATSSSPSVVRGLDYNVTDGWIEVPPPPCLFLDSDRYLTSHPRPVGTSGDWRHLAIFNQSSKSFTFLTDGQEEIDAIYAYDPNNKVVYYSSTNGDPTERHIKKVGLPGSPDSGVVCLTCGSSPDCRYITSSFSDSGNHYFVNCRGPEIPTYTLRSRLDSNKNIVLQDNAQVKALLAEKALPTRQFINISIGGGYEGVAEIFTPPDHVQGSTYPLLIYAYAGPGSQRVMKTFPIGGSTANWLTYLKSSHKIAVVSLDSRGASGRGDKFKFEMYRKLMTVEIQDQISAAMYFNTVPMIDKERRKAIFGWSYGGSAAAHVIGDTSQHVMCGIAVAPVTSMAYYDTAYTERYLGLDTPEDNEVGYNMTDVMNKVNNFKDKAFMIAHGTADDNVHYMQATQMIRALEDADIMFRQNAYIDQDHGISSPGQSRHIYHSMTEFLLNDCWSGTLNKPTQAPPISAGGVTLVQPLVITACLLFTLV